MFAEIQTGILTVRPKTICHRSFLPGWGKGKASNYGVSYNHYCLAHLTTETKSGYVGSSGTVVLVTKLYSFAQNYQLCKEFLYKVFQWKRHVLCPDWTYETFDYTYVILHKYQFAILLFVAFLREFSSKNGGVFFSADESC